MTIAIIGPFDFQPQLGGKRELCGGEKGIQTLDLIMGCKQKKEELFRAVWSIQFLAGARAPNQEKGGKEAKEGKKQRSNEGVRRGKNQGQTLGLDFGRGEKGKKGGGQKPPLLPSISSSSPCAIAFALSRASRFGLCESL